MHRARAVVKSLSAVYHRRPVLCNACMYTAMFAVSDIAQQTILKRPEYDWPNIRNMAIVGGTFFGPAYHYWYHYLDVFFPGKKNLVIAKKLFFDQFIAGIVTIVVFFPCE
jgi:hypothetical protein